MFFNDDIELKNREYDEKYVSEKPGEMSFEKGKIVKKDKFWIYDREINNTHVASRLKKSQKSIPNSTDEFLSGYKKAERK